ncbi:hypothetical protein [Vagococcus sp. WN89Y]|uniref:hypothetical protein n=1 Tax=Vagococcus sp. WN89Y TaxID=3457258 RepID=UPI003FCDFC8E
MQHIWLDSGTVFQPHLAAALSAPDYRGPKVYFSNESEAAGNSYPAFTETEAEWLLVQHNGRQVQQAVERAIAQNQQSQTFCPARPLLRATGFLAGLALAGGLGTWFYNRWRSPAAGDGAQNDIALRHYDGMPAAQALIDNAWVSTTAEPVTLSEEQAIEHEVIDFLNNENGSFDGGKPRKEALIATLAVWLFPTGQPYEAEDKVIKLAGRILYGAGRYGGKPGEALSASLAKAVIRNWVFNTILGARLRDYIAGKIVADKYPTYFTLSSLTHLLSLPKLHTAGLLFANNVPPAMWGNLNAMWHTFLREEIPAIDDAEYKEAGTWSLADYNFLAFSTGADYLADLGNIKQFNLSEIATVGASIWGKMASEGASADMLPYLVTPSLWFVAQTKPDTVQKMLTEKKPWAQSVVLDALAGWKKAQQRADKIEKHVNAYQEALNLWRSKGQLADTIIARCPISAILVYRDDRHNPQNEREEAWKKTVREGAKERYLCCNTPPCKRDDVPGSLSDEYKKITRNVADAYQKLDEILLDHTLTSAQKDEAEFIYSDDAVLHPAYLHMRTKKTPFAGMGGVAYSGDFSIETDHADLFAVKNKNEERIYALKRGESVNSGYTLHRINRDIDLYIKNGILSHKHLWKNYQQTDGKIVAGGYEFSFAVSVNPHSKLSLKKTGSNIFIGSFFSQQHGNSFYDTLYQAGHDYSGTEKIWHAVKHIIPFYDCIDGVSSGDSLQIAQALPSCMLDALAFVPVIGQAAALGGKYGMSLAQGIRRGVFKASQGASSAAIAASMSKGIALPTSAQIQNLLKNSLRAMDPGFELLCKGSVMAGKLIAGVSDAALAAKLNAAATTKEAAQKTTYLTAKLPDNGPEVSVKKLENDFYVIVNPQTDEAFGNYYHLNDGELSQVDIRYHLPEDPQPSGSRPKRPKLDPESAHGQAPASANYNQLPPPANNVEYWRSVQRITEEPVDLTLPKESHTEIQKLERFLPLTVPPDGSVEGATDAATALMDSILSPHFWRAWAGTKAKPDDDIPPYIAQLRLKLEENIRASSMAHVLVRNKLWSLQHHEQLINTDVGQYLSGILDTHEPAVINEAFKRLMLIVERGDVFLNASKDVDYSNFIIISTDHIPDSVDAEKYISPLDKESLINSPVAFVMIPDPEKRIFINAERYQNAFLDSELVCGGDKFKVQLVSVDEGTAKKEAAGEDAAKKESDDEGELYEDIIEEISDDEPPELNYASRLSDDLNHEITHITSNTGDMFSYYFPPKGQLHNGQDLLDVFIENLDPRTEDSEIPMLFEKKNFIDFVEQLRHAQGIDGELSHPAVIHSISTDPMLFANILMNDAEILSTIIRDLAEGRAFDAQVRFRRAIASAKKPHANSDAIYQHSVMTLVARQAISSTL